jgi:hypothetical protein
MGPKTRDQKRDEEIYDALAELLDKKLNNDRYDKLLQLNQQLIEQNRQLKERIEALEQRVTVADLVANVIEEVALDARKPPPTAPKPDTRNQLKTLILSDSMMRHVSVYPDTVKEILPGACCDELFHCFRELNETNTYQNIVVSVGTNYLQERYWSNDDIACEIGQFLVGLNNLTPETTTITFAQILPKRGRLIKKLYLSRINHINHELDAFTNTVDGIDFINYHDHGPMLIANVDTNTKIL